MAEAKTAIAANWILIVDFLLFRFCRFGLGEDNFTEKDVMRRKKAF